MLSASAWRISRCAPSSAAFTPLQSVVSAKRYSTPSISTSSMLHQASEKIGIPPLGIGSWLADKGKTGAALKHAHRSAGYRHFDCAPIYGNQAEIGEIAFAGLQPGEREKIWVTSKLWLTDMQPDDVQAACESTLRELGLDYLDCFMVHWPVPLAKDAPGRGSSAAAAREGIKSLRDQDFIADKVPLKDTWSAMENLVDKGLVRHLGICNASVAKLKSLEDVRHQPAVLQVELHPYLQQNDLLRFCAERGIAVTAFSPLGSPGSRVLYAGGPPADAGPMEDPVVQDIAAAQNRLPAQVLLRWAIQRGTIAIPKSITPERIDSNAQVLDWELTHEQMERMNSLDRHRRYLLGKFYCKPGESLQEFWGDATKEPEAGRMM